MEKGMQERYIKELIKDKTKEELAEMIIKRDERICSVRAFINQIYAGGTGLTIDECVEKLEQFGETELAESLQGVKSYLSTGNRYLGNWTD